jgi:hypothetical protein
MKLALLRHQEALAGWHSDALLYLPRARQAAASSRFLVALEAKIRRRWRNEAVLIGRKSRFRTQHSRRLIV